MRWWHEYDKKYYFAASIISQGVSFANLALVTSFLALKEIGGVGIFEIILLFFKLLAGAQTEQIINKRFFEEKNSLNQLISKVWLINWGINVLFLLISAAAAISFSGVLVVPFTTETILIYLTAAFISSLTTIPYTILRISGKARSFFMYSNVLNVGKILFVISIFLYHADALNYVIAVGASASLAVIAGVYQCRSYISFRNMGSVSVGDDVRTFALPLVPSQILSYFNQSADRIVVERMGGLTMLGIYTVGLKVSAVITSLHETLKLAYGSSLWRLKNKRIGLKVISNISHLYSSVLYFMFIAGGAAGLIYAKLFVDPSFHNHFFIIYPVMATVFLQTLTLYFGSGAMLTGNVKVLVLSQIGGLIVFIGACLTGYQYDPILVVLTAKFLAMVTSFGLQYYFSQAALQIPFNRRIIAFYFISTTILLALTLMFNDLGSLPFIQVAVCVVFGLILLKINEAIKISEIIKKGRKLWP